MIVTPYRLLGILAVALAGAAGAGAGRRTQHLDHRRPSSGRPDGARRRQRRRTALCLRGRRLRHGCGGGLGAPGGTLVYDARTNAWRQVKPPPGVQDSAQLVTGANGRIYSVGGRVRGNWVGALSSYNPSTNAWTALKPFPAPRQSPAATGGPDGRIYVAGGIGDGNGHLLQVLIGSAPSNSPPPLFRTDDGGLSWHLVKVPSLQGVNALTCVTAALCYGDGSLPTSGPVAPKASLIRGVDGGETWTPIGKPSTTIGFGPLACLGPDACIVTNSICYNCGDYALRELDATLQQAGTESDIYLTSDGGTTWADKPAPPDLSTGHRWGATKPTFGGAATTSTAASDACQYNRHRARRCPRRSQIAEVAPRPGSTRGREEPSRTAMLKY